MIDPCGQQQFVEVQRTLDGNDLVVLVVEDDGGWKSRHPTTDCWCEEPEEVGERFDGSGWIRRYELHRGRCTKGEPDQAEPIGVGVGAADDGGDRFG